MSNQQASESLYECPEFSINAQGWGPNALPEQFEDLPFSLFSRDDGLGTIVDVTHPSVFQRARGLDGNEEDSSFIVVDNTRTFTTHKPKLIHTKQQRFNNQNQNNWVGKEKKGNQKKTGGQNLRRNYDALHIPSVNVKDSWEAIAKMDFSDLAKLSTKTVPTVSNLAECGSIQQYINTFDRIPSTKPVMLTPQEKCDNLSFVSAEKDPFLSELASTGVAQVYTTDVALAHLMVATHSQFSWDLQIIKNSRGIFISHRDEVFNEYTVHETSADLPTEEENKDNCLKTEVTTINRDFAKQVMGDPVEKAKFPSPFPSSVEEENRLHRLYRYRKFTLDDIVLLVRTEVHGQQVRDSKKQFLQIYAINEWCNRTPLANRWRQKLANFSGYPLAEEVKNNNFRLSKWGVQAMLSGVDAVKVGLVTRRDMKNAEAGHVILGVQSYSLDVFMKQMMLNERNMWAVFEDFVKMISKQEDGHYVLMKDPMKSMLRVYRVPEEEVVEGGESEYSESGSEYSDSEYSEYSESESEYSEYSESENEE